MVIAGKMVTQTVSDVSTSNNPKNNRLERRTTLMARQLARDKVDIAALSETRFSDQGQLEKSTALAVLGRVRCQHHNWFDDNDAAISTSLAEKNRLHKTYVDRPTDDNKAAFCRSHHLVQQRLREVQDAPTARKVEEIQGYADRNVAIKSVFGPPTKGTAPLLIADGSTLPTEKIQILQQWTEHCRGVLNRPSTICDAAIARLHQVETNADLDLPPSLQLQLSSDPC
nr:unnamed protein product [Spirometra erinaceieuropaei]